MADNLTLALKIKADLNQALSNIKSLERTMQQTGTAGAQLGQKSAVGAKGLDGLGRSADEAAQKLGKTRAGVESISKQLQRLQTLGVGAIVGKYVGAAIGDVGRIADEYNNYQSRISLISKSNQDAARTFKELMTVANDTGQLFGATADLYTRVYRAMGNNADGAQLLAFTKTINQSMAVSGASASEAGAAIIQLSQAMASGALRGDEFNSVSEQAPVILEMLEKSLKKTRGELREMAAEGKLTTAVILQAVSESADDIQAQYDRMPKTIGRAVNELTNAWMSFVGQTDNVTSASSVVASAISGLAKNLDLLAAAALTVASIMAVRMVAAYAAKLSMMSRLVAMSLVANRTATARGVIEVKLAQSALAAAKSTDAQAAATARLTAAERALNVVRAASRTGATGGLLGGLGSGLMALVGGPIGIAVTAIAGLVMAYQTLKSREEELEAQYRAGSAALLDNIDKTKALLEAREKAAGVQTYSQLSGQEVANNKAIGEAKKQLEALTRERDKLYQSMMSDSTGGGVWGTEQLEQYDTRIKGLKASIDNLSAANRELSDITRNQLNSAFQAAISAGGEFADKLQLLAGINPQEALRLLTESIKESETELQSMQGELDSIEKKLRDELINATTTATERIEQMRAKIIALANSAGWSAQQLDMFIGQLNTILSLQKQIETAKTQKEGQEYLDRLRERRTTQGMTTAQKIKYDNRKKGLTGADLEEADKLADSIQANEKRKSSGKRKNTAEEIKKQNLELNIQYLRLTGQEVKANLLDVESRYNKMLAEFQKAGNVDGINLIKKLLPLEQAKVQVAGIQAEIDKLYSAQSAQEQRINAQVQTGLISHLEGQRQLKDVYAQTAAEIEKQLPLLQKLAQMPGAQAEQARAMLAQLQNKIAELKAAGNDLTDAFEDGLTNGIQQALMGLSDGTMSLRDAIKNLTLTILNSMAQIASQQLAMQAMSGLKGIFGGVLGSVTTAATGGYIRGPGTGTSDSIPAMLSNGEYVVKAATVAKYGVGFMHALNAGRVSRFAGGGLVSQPAMPQFSEPGLSRELQEGVIAQAVAAPVNIQQTLVMDSAEAFKSGLNTVAGSRAMITFIQNQKQTIKQIVQD